MALTPSEREKARALSDRTGARGSLTAGDDKSLSNRWIGVHARFGEHALARNGPPLSRRRINGGEGDSTCWIIADYLPAECDRNVFPSSRAFLDAIIALFDGYIPLKPVNMEKNFLNFLAYFCQLFF